jgi:hypothetical protein
MKKILILLLIYYGICNGSLYAQYTTDKVVGQKNTSVIDSLKTVEYPYLLPIWGEKVARKGFQLPKSAGLSVQYLWQRSDIIINNLQVGFNNGPMHNLDEIIRFDKAQTNTNGINVRPDFWILPFLNVYGIYAQSKTSTSIAAGAYLPNDSGWRKVLDIKTKANFKANTFGFGLTPTVGVGGFFLALDMNFSWSDIAELDKPAYAFVFGPRLGKNIKLKKPESSIAMWVGGFRVKLNTGTTGNLNASDLFPTATWQSKIDTGYMKLAASQQKVDDWWNGLTPPEQKNPVNVAKHEVANAAFERFGAFLASASQGVSNASNATIQYSLDKKPKDMWNFIIGSQYQINRAWMIRAEYGFLSARSQFIGGLQYRFNL